MSESKRLGDSSPAQALQPLRLGIWLSQSSEVPDSYGQSPCYDSGFQRVWLKRNLHFKGWNSHVHKGFSGSFESANLSRYNLSREIQKPAPRISEPPPRISETSPQSPKKPARKSRKPAPRVSESSPQSLRSQPPGVPFAGRPYWCLWTKHSFYKRSCHILLFQPILWNRYLPSEPVKTARNSPPSISDGGRIWRVWQNTPFTRACSLQPSSKPAPEFVFFKINFPNRSSYPEECFFTVLWL